MSNKRHRRDDNHEDIQHGLEKVGISVCDISQGDHAAGDLLAGTEAGNFLLEIKNPKNISLTPNEKKFREAWKGPHAIVTTLNEALIILGYLIATPNLLPWWNSKKKICYNYVPGKKCCYRLKRLCDGCLNSGEK